MNLSNPLVFLTRTCACLQKTKLIILKYSSSSTSRVPQSSEQYCVDLVRKHDYEQYLCTLLLPKEVRRAAFAIRAFNTELAIVRDLVSNQTLGMMRLQFWRDTLEQVYREQPPQQPVALELARVFRKQKLSKLWMKKLIDIREQSLGDHPHHSIQELEEYAHNSVSSVYYLILEFAGIKDVKADHVGDHIGKAQGISNLLRGIPFNAARGRVYVPTQLLVKNNLSQEDFVRGNTEQKLKDVIYDIASAAHQHIEMAISLQNETPVQARRILFLPMIPCRMFLNELQNKDFHIFDSKLHSRNNLLPFVLWWATIRRKYS